MYRWDGNNWEELDTKEKSKDSAYTWFEAYTNRFSPFSISGWKNELYEPRLSEQEVIMYSGTSAPEEAHGKENAGLLSGFLGVVAVFCLIVIAILMFYLARQNDQASS